MSQIFDIGLWLQEIPLVGYFWLRYLAGPTSNKPLLKSKIEQSHLDTEQPCAACAKGKNGHNPINNNWIEKTIGTFVPWSSYPLES